MIDFQRVRKQYGAQMVLNDVSFRINPGERVGVVGPNGAGKSTVFQLISGETEPDAGVVQRPRDLRLGHLHQQLNAHAVTATLLDYAAAQPDLDALHAELVRLEHSADAATPPVQRRMGELQHAYEHAGGYDARARAGATLGGLGFPESDFARPFRDFSGGWQMRAELARTLVGRPDLLLLDEPSNYLDLPAVEWLQRFLRSFTGTLLLISHDRWLLRTLTDRTLEIAGGHAVFYAGGYDYYCRERDQRREQQLAAHRNYAARRDQLEQFIRRFRAQASKAALVQSRIKLLEKMEEVPAPPAPPDLSHLRIATPPHCGAHVLRLRGAGVTYDGRRWIFRGVELDLTRGDQVALVGYNGLGKTTLLRALAGARPLSEGERRLGAGVVVGYQSQDFAETMPPGDSVFQIVKQAHPSAGDREIRTLLGSFGFSGAAADKRCGVLSGGEKIRLAFARLFIRPPNLLLLDEPTTHLDIHGREALERALRDYRGTVCLVSHDVTFVRNTARRIVALTPPGLTLYAGGYDYFLEKTAATSGAAAPAPSAPVAAPAGEGPLRGRDARRERAQQRAAAQARRALETELDAAQRAREELHAAFAAAPPDANFAELSRQLAAANARLSELEDRWLRETMDEE